MWLFFRNDDLGWQPEAFARMVTLFAKHDQKLNAAAIPSACTDSIIQASIPYSYQAAPFLQIVTHGFAHQNYEGPETKKAEFGVSRESGDVFRELVQGKKQLSEQFENYFPCFVPPWNRFHDRFLPLLGEAGYSMLSREVNVAKAAQRASIPEFDIALDLHTAKGGERLSAKEVFRDLARRQEAGHDHCGVMLHHCKMTDEDYQTLDELLRDLSKRSIASVFFSEMLPGGARRRGVEVTHV